MPNTSDKGSAGRWCSKRRDGCNESLGYSAEDGISMGKRLEKTATLREVRKHHFDTENRIDNFIGRTIDPRFCLVPKRQSMRRCNGFR